MHTAVTRNTAWRSKRRKHLNYEKKKKAWDEVSLQLSCYPYSLCIVEHLALIWPFLLEAHQAHPAAAQWFVADPAALKSAGKADGSSDAPGLCRVRERAPQPIRSIVASGSIVQPR